MPRVRPWPILLLLVLLSLLLTWPLLPLLLTHVPGDGIDDPSLAWNLWWAKHSWVDRAGLGGLAHNPFDGDSMFHPVGINLAFYTLTLLNGALSIPLQVASSVTLASNLLLLSSFVIGGFGTYLLALEILTAVGVRGGRQTMRLAASLAALLYAFASAKLFYVALGQFNIASSQWLPFIALYLVRCVRMPFRWRNAVLLGLFLCLQTWAELTYGTFGVLLVAIVVGAILLFWLLRRIASRLRASPPPTASHLPLLASAVVAGGIFVIGLSPYLVNMLTDLRTEGDFLVEGGGFSDIFSADLVGFVLPTQLHPIFGGIVRAISDDSALRADRSQFMVNKGQHLFFGFGVMVLAAIGVWAYRRRAWTWGVALLTGFFTLVALGPVVRINGYETSIPGIFPLLLKIPFFQANRYPSRYSVMILLGLSVLVALGATRVLNTRALSSPPRRVIVSVALAALLLFEHLSIPLPLSDFRLPPAYNAVIADEQPGALLDLPVGWRNGFNVFGKSDVIIMFEQWYQTFHGRPLLGGNTSRNPEHKFQYFMEHPVIGVLAALQDGRPVSGEDMRIAQTLAPDLLRFLNIHTVLVHRQRVSADFEQQLARLFPLDFVSEQGGIARYEARWPAERASAVIAAGDPEMKSYLQQGWGPSTPTTGDASLSGQPVVWATRTLAKLLLPGLSQPAEFHLSVFAPTAQTVTLLSDGEEIARQTLAPGVNVINFQLPASDDGFPRRLDLRADPTLDAGQRILADRAIGGTGVESPVNLVVRSAGKDTGDFGHIFVNGVDQSPNQRGYNLVAIDAESGQMLDAAAFDTHAPYLTDESERMAMWIEALPAGVVVAGAVRDAAALNLSDEAVRALQTLGVHNDIRGSLRRAHAFVGVKGAAASSAADLYSDEWPVTVTIGEGFTEASPTLALVELSWTPAQ